MPSSAPTTISPLQHTHCGFHYILEHILENIIFILKYIGKCTPKIKSYSSKMAMQACANKLNATFLLYLKENSKDMKVIPAYCLKEILIIYRVLDDLASIIINDCCLIHPHDLFYRN